MLLLLLAACAHHIPEPAVLPAAADPGGASVRVCWVELLHGELPHGLAVAHGALKTNPPSTQSGLLLDHPDGAWLIDGGQALDAEAEKAGVRGLRRVFLNKAAAGWTRDAAPADAVRARGVDPAALAGLLPTHAHFDHLGGLLDLPGPPIWMPAAEIALAQATLDGAPPAVLPYDARGVVPRARVLTFDGPPLWSWPASHDLYGDGSVVLVPMPGHTPGSVGARVRAADGRVLFLVGDTVWVREGFEQREPKSWLAGTFDADGDATSAQIAQLWALHRDHPEVAILPAHDRRAWVDAFGAPGCIGERPAPTPDTAPPADAE